MNEAAKDLLQICETFATKKTCFNVREVLLGDALRRFAKRVPPVLIDDVLNESEDALDNSHHIEFSN
jgi:hypothetical protein